MATIDTIYKIDILLISKKPNLFKKEPMKFFNLCGGFIFLYIVWLIIIKKLNKAKYTMLERGSSNLSVIIVSSIDLRNKAPPKLMKWEKTF